MKTIFKEFLASIVLALSVCSGAHASLYYDNGPYIFNFNAVAINNGYSVSNSFSFASAGTATFAEVLLWAPVGATPTSLIWSLGSSAFGSDYGSASTTFFGFTNNQSSGYEEFVAQFSFSASVPGGESWFTLSNAMAPSGADVYWGQQIGGVSTAYQSSNGGASKSVVTSNYFRIGGDELIVVDPVDPAAVPEPSTVALFALGVFGLISLRRKNKL